MPSFKTFPCVLLTPSGITLSCCGAVFLLVTYVFGAVDNVYLGYLGILQVDNALRFTVRPCLFTFLLLKLSFVPQDVTYTIIHVSSWLTYLVLPQVFIGLALILIVAIYNSGRFDFLNFVKRSRVFPCYSYTEVPSSSLARSLCWPSEYFLVFN